MASQAIGIDIGTHAIKIAVLQKKGAITKATRLYRSKLAGDTDVERIQGALRRAGISGGPGLLGITGRDLIIRYTHVPPVPDWRLKLLMQFEINEVSGQSGGEVAADYSRLELPTEADDNTVLVALCRNSYLQPRLDGVVSAGMKAGGGCPNSVALFNAFLQHGSFEEGETTYIVNLGRDNIDMAVQRDGELLFARNMAGGGGLFTEAIMSTFGLKEGKAETNKLKKGDLTPKAQARYPDSTSEKVANAMQGPAGQLVSMIQSTVMICRAQTKIPDLNIDRLLLTGGGARMKGIRAYFQQSMSVPVEIFDPVDELDVSGLHPNDANELGEHPLDFAVAVGLAETLLRSTSKRLEVLTESAKKKRHFMERTIWALGAAAAALLLVVLLFQTRAADIEVVQTANARLTAEHKKYSDRDKAGKAAAAKELDARLKEVTLRSRRINGTFALAIFELLEKKHPEKYFYIRRIHIEPERVALDLDGIPILKGAGRVTDGGPIKRIHHQMVWPTCEVIGVVQKEAPKAPDRLQNYYQSLKTDLPAVRGFQMKLETESFRNAEQEFKMTFSLVVPEKAKKDAEG